MKQKERKKLNALSIELSGSKGTEKFIYLFSFKVSVIVLHCFFLTIQMVITSTRKYRQRQQTTQRESRVKPSRPKKTFSASHSGTTCMATAQAHSTSTSKLGRGWVPLFGPELVPKATSGPRQQSPLAKAEHHTLWVVKGWVWSVFGMWVPPKAH